MKSCFYLFTLFPALQRCQTIIWEMSLGKKLVKLEIRYKNKADKATITFQFIYLVIFSFPFFAVV